MRRLKAATDERYRAQLEQALKHLDAKLVELGEKDLS